MVSVRGVPWGAREHSSRSIQSNCEMGVVQFGAMRKCKIMHHAFGGATQFLFQTVRPDLVIPRVQGLYEQMPKSIACVSLRRSSNSVSNKYDLAPSVRGCERISEAPVSRLIRFSEFSVQVGCLRDLVHL